MKITNIIMIFYNADFQGLNLGIIYFIIILISMYNLNRCSNKILIVNVIVDAFDLSVIDFNTIFKYTSKDLFIDI